MVTLAEARIYLRLDVYVGDTAMDLADGADVERMIAAACDHLRTLDVNMSIDPLPPAVKQAVLMLVAHFYEHREAMSNFQHFSMDIGVDRLIAPFREYSV